MSSNVVNEVFEALTSMTAFELYDLKGALEDEWGVSPSMIVPPGSPPGTTTGLDDEEEKDSFDVVLTAIGEKKIAVIKVARAITSLGLKETKDLVEGPSPVIYEGATKEEAEKFKIELEEAGARVELR